MGKSVTAAIDFMQQWRYTIDEEYNEKKTMNQAKPPAKESILGRLTIASRLSSIRYALAGIASALKTEPNTWIHFFATIVVVALSFFFAISAAEWCLIIIAIALVWSSELMNTAIEAICDQVSPEHQPLIKQAKDSAAAAVLICAFAALLIGCIIFIPKLIEFISSTTLVA